MLKEYTRRNSAYKMAAPMAKDARSYNKKPPASMAGAFIAQPMLGEDYHYGFAIIPSTKRFNLCEYHEVNPMGWMLPGCRWTNDSELVKQQAMEMDRLIRLNGGLKDKAA